MQVNMKEQFNSVTTGCCIHIDRYIYHSVSIFFQLRLQSVCQLAHYRYTDIHNSAGPSFHSALLMGSEQQLLKILQAHIHILHGI